MNKKLFIFLFATVFCTSAAFAQGRGGGGGGTARGGGGLGGAPVGGPSIPSGPSNPQANRPSNLGKPDSPSAAADHKADAASAHAVDPTDTHGFKNYGQYIAANEVADRLGIPLADLKVSMDAEGGNLGKRFTRSVQI